MRSEQQWFGEPWHAVVCDLWPRAEVPVGMECGFCDERFVAQSRGVILPYSGLPDEDDAIAYHIECFKKVLGL